MTTAHRTWRLAFAASLLLVAWLSLRPMPNLDLPARSDLGAHLVLHAGLAVLAILSNADARRRRIALAGVLAFGVALELLQGLVPGRHPSMSDVVANAAGVGIAAFAWRRGLRRRR